MDLAIEEVAQLFDLSKDVLVEWIQEGKLPAYSINGSYRFDREEVEAWVLRQDTASLPTPFRKKGQGQFNLYRALHKGEVYIDIQASDKHEAIRQVVAKIAPLVHLDPHILSEFFIQREDLSSTSLGNGFAIPHARETLLNQYDDLVAVAFLEDPIAYDSLDGQPVHTLFFLLASSDKKHLGLLSKVAHLISSDFMRHFLRTKPPKAALLEQIKHWESALSPQ